MKNLIYIDNDLKDKAEESFGIAKRLLKFNGGLDKNIVNQIKLIDNFNLISSKFEDQLFDTNNVIITWSMFTENHFGSYHQLCDFMVMAALQQLKNKIYIDTATYLRETLEKAIEYYNQSIYIIRCIENNYIIHYNADDTKFYRLRFDVNSEDFLKNEEVSLNQLIK